MKKLRSSHHFLGCFPFAALFFFSFNLEYAIIFAIWSIMIDVDHVFLVYWETGQFSLNPFTEWKLLQDKSVRAAHREEYWALFHFVEIWLFILPLTFYWPILFPFVTSSLFHILSDFVDNFNTRRKDPRQKKAILTLLPIIYKHYKVNNSSRGN